jgi:outer membrane protein assembly factor BamB
MFHVGCCAGAIATMAMAGWPQWGGPKRDFTVETTGLADSWPEDGPKRIWHRELGDGYSSLVTDGNVLYTLYRKAPDADHETTIAVDARSGETIWEHSVPSKVKQPLDEWGYSPNSTPLIVDEHLYTIGANAVMHCYRKRDGKVIWQHDLAIEFGAPFPGEFGCAYSPVAHKNMVIVPVGAARQEGHGRPGDEQALAVEEGPAGEGSSLVAFDQESGSVIWQRHRYEVGFTSPLVINFDGQDHLVLMTSRELVGISPANGDVIWSYAFPRGGGDVMTPLWIEPNLLFCSSGDQNIGSRMIRLEKRDGRIVPGEVWHTRKARFIQANPVHVDGVIVGSSGQAATAIVMGVDVQTGKRLWVKRCFEQASYVYGDGKVIFLDWNGNLALATATKDGIAIHSQARVAERYSMTAPTLVGKTLYVRDRKHIMALDLG